MNWRNNNGGNCKSSCNALIHRTSVIENGARLGNNVKIGPFCFVGKDVVLADDVELKTHVVIENKVSVGEGTRIYSFAVIGGAPQNLRHHGVGAEVIIGRNNIIREHVTINLGTEADAMKTVIGDNCYIMISSHIAHDCILGNNVVMANNATLAGHVHIEDNVFIGGLSAIHQFVRIGKNVMIGGVTGVGQDVIPFTMVTGTRAGVAGLNVIGLKRNGFSENDILMLKKAYRILFDPSPGRTIEIGIKDIEENLAPNKHVEHLLGFLKSKTSRGISRPKIFCNEETQAI
jgi:UDP-N-acetylglucosamine acyltransferase